MRRYAVACLRNVFAFRTQFFDLGDFSGGFDLRFHRIKAKFTGHGGGSMAVVTH
ncbi:MAG: hypothetical protein WBP42_10605 [Candidatus Zixiibacteriota bacterium]